ncbi:hypothetical protein F2Q68_00011260 [Brassica cretica]|uniref:Uncharacterized protein n=1 Tax=Brassica cretica TaxID=69181 RepID=A0A8S9KNR8_BRACR|nr:hypothetical protein F2Q68_00011260 [Brassica cretica]
MGEDDPHRVHLVHGRGRPAPRSPRPWVRTNLPSRNRASSSKFPLHNPRALGRNTHVSSRLGLSKKDFGKSYKNLVVEMDSFLSYKTAMEKINVNFLKIIMKGDEKWKSPSRDESGPGKDNGDLQGRLG